MGQYFVQSLHGVLNLRASSASSIKTDSVLHVIDKVEMIRVSIEFSKNVLKRHRTQNSISSKISQFSFRCYGWSRDYLYMLARLADSITNFKILCGKSDDTRFNVFLGSDVSSLTPPCYKTNP